ncbi:MAG: hypothetical protein QOI80_3299 [Solirubrobacteraceae bacterium]|jgi:hypothetical protein|nr:hypothetical protein [Solirubrobacteraceae bacterium]
MKRGSLATAFALVLCGAAAANASAATTRAVDDDGMATPKNCNAATPASPTIQGAVAASSSGDTIVVCPGTYVEQVTIPAGKDRLTLVSSSRRQAIIKAPPTSNATYTRFRPDLVRVEGAKDASFVQFTITGPLADDQFCNEGLNSAVHILGGGSANLLDNRITKARANSPALLGCQNGFGVQIGRRFEGDTGTGRLFGNEIDDYQKGGIYVDNAGSTLIASGNVVRGPDLSAQPAGLPLAAPNGVQISRGSDAYFDHNAVLDNVFPGVKDNLGNEIPGLEAGQASGVIVFNNSGEDGSEGDVSVSDNLVKNNDTNVALFNRDKAVIDDNTLLDAPFYDGLYADVESENNRFTDNAASGNAEHDCHDDSNGSGTAGTANLWKNNTGETENRPGLCKKKRGGHDGDDDGHDGHGHHHGRMR